MQILKKIKSKIIQKLIRGTSLDTFSLIQDLKNNISNIVNKELNNNIARVVNKELKNEMPKLIKESLREEITGNHHRTNRRLDYENTAQLLRDIFNEQGFKYFFTFGSLVSLIRDKYLEPYQGDIDIAVEEEHFEKMLHILSHHPRFILIKYKTEVFMEDEFPSDRPLIERFDTDENLVNFDPSYERLLAVQYFDTLTLTKLDFYVIRPYKNSHMMLLDIPFVVGRSCYLNLPEYSSGTIDIRYPSMIYPEFMREYEEEKLHTVSYRILKDYKPFLDRCYPAWDIKRMQKHSWTYYSDLKLKAEKNNEIPGYYLEFMKNPIHDISIMKNIDYMYTYNITL